jgi:hypothetical protein
MDDVKEEKEEIKIEPEIKDHTVQPSLTCGKGEHYFVQVSGTEVRCRKCPVGYNIGPGYEVKNGHVILHGQLLI